MGRQAEPINLIVAKGKKHLTKEEIRERRERELQPVTAGIAPPDFLTTKKQREHFDRIAAQLQRLGIMGESDVETLGRYVIAQELYVKLTKKLSTKAVIDNPLALSSYMANQTKAFNQAHQCARELGLTITARCKLVVPEAGGEAPRASKFAKFEKKATG